MFCGTDWFGWIAIKSWKKSLKAQISVKPTGGTKYSIYPRSTYTTFFNLRFRGNPMTLVVLKKTPQMKHFFEIKQKYKNKIQKYNTEIRLFTVSWFLSSNFSMLIDCKKV